jgi:hypothetical protein
MPFRNLLEGPHSARRVLSFLASKMTFVVDLAIDVAHDSPGVNSWQRVQGRGTRNKYARVELSTMQRGFGGEIKTPGKGARVSTVLY